MARKSLKTLTHMDSQVAEEEYQKRVHSENTIHFPLEIGGFPAFCVHTGEISSLICSIPEKNAELNRLSALLPDLPLIRENFLLDEIQMSNDIEGVYAPRKLLRQIRDQNTPDALPFSGLIRQYSLLLNPAYGGEIRTCQDIRDQYDQLLVHDMEMEDAENLPDGQLFRKNQVGVFSGVKQIHSGIVPEEKIIRTLQDGLDFVAGSQEDPFIRISFFHFLFGYVHPFYDGNGRMNRYISTLMLEKHLNLLSTLQLSCMIRKNRKQYYDQFQLAEHPLNKGELTEFIQFFLTMLDDSVSHVLSILNEKKEQYDRLILRKNDFTEQLDRKLYQILLTQTLFSFQGIRKKQLAEKAGCPENTVSSFIQSHKDMICEERDGTFTLYSLKLAELRDPNRSQGSNV